LDVKITTVFGLAHAECGFGGEVCCLQLTCFVIVSCCNFGWWLLVRFYAKHHVVLHIVLDVAGNEAWSSSDR